MPSELDPPVPPETTEPEATEPETTEPAAVAERPSLKDYLFYLPGVLVGLGFIAAFWPLMVKLVGIWFGDDTYYAHGAIVPLCSAFIVYERWDDLKKHARPGPWWTLVPLLGLFWVTYVAAGNSTRVLMSLLLIATLLVAAVFLTGWGGFRRTATPILYLAFAMPFWDAMIDRYTQPLQQLSTDGAYAFLTLARLDPMREDATTIYLANFNLDVGIPCSGLKLLLAVASIVVFFMMIAKVKWWANVLLLASVIPLTLAVNALRIGLIGVVGNAYGHDAGMAFHDYSGYIALVVCFVLLMKLTKVLGWKS